MSTCEEIINAVSNCFKNDSVLLDDEIFKNFVHQTVKKVVLDYYKEKKPTGEINYKELVELSTKKLCNAELELPEGKVS